MPFKLIRIWNNWVVWPELLLLEPDCRQTSSHHRHTDDLNRRVCAWAVRCEHAFNIGIVCVCLWCGLWGQCIHSWFRSTFSLMMKDEDEHWVTHFSVFGICMLCLWSLWWWLQAYFLLPLLIRCSQKTIFMVALISHHFIYFDECCSRLIKWNRNSYT